MAVAQGQVGPQVASDGTFPDIRMGKTGEQISSELQGRYYENAYRGNTFIASTPASVTWAAGLTTTAAVMAIANPATSGKNLVLVSIGYSLSATTAAIAALSFQGYSSVLSATTTSVVINNAFVGSGNKTVAQTTLTLQSTPAVGPVLGGMVGASSSATWSNYIDLGGAFIIGPGCAVALEMSAAQAGFASLTWVEVAI